MTNEDVNLAITKIAGWTDIKPWRNGSQLLVGTNLSTNQANKYVPIYIDDLSAISKLFLRFNLKWQLTVNDNGRSYASSSEMGLPRDAQTGDTPEIALCKLLIELMSDI